MTAAGAPPAWLPSLADFVRRHPGALAGGVIVRARAAFFDARRQVQLGRAHALMRREPYAADRDRYRLADHWAIDPAGDCEDRALAAQAFLASRGWPRSCLWLYVVTGRRWWWGGRFGHAVLTAWLADRVVMLDNLAATPVLLDRPPALREQDRGDRLAGYAAWVRVDPALIDGASS